MNKQNTINFSLVAKLCVVLVFVLAISKTISLRIQINDLEQQCIELDEAIAQKKVVNEDLKESLDEGITDESIAKIARDVLGYASPGERVFIDSSEQ